MAIYDKESIVNSIFKKIFTRCVLGTETSVTYNEFPFNLPRTEMIDDYIKVSKDVVNVLKAKGFTLDYTYSKGLSVSWDNNTKVDFSKLSEKEKEFANNYLDAKQIKEITSENAKEKALDEFDEWNRLIEKRTDNINMHLILGNANVEEKELAQQMLSINVMINQLAINGYVINFDFLNEVELPISNVYELQQLHAITLQK
ncbi:hypothetical protein ACR56S_03640 [Staphylococcus hominis]|uniref:hypothetical protein n=1 Tax=Staphylococcus hominis TaxID=1290 RepID=UPI003DA0CE07